MSGAMRAQRPTGVTPMGASASRVRLLAVCADDFGLDAKVNQGALHLARLGRVTAISCMVGAPHWDGGATELRTLDAAAVDAGLHLDLTQHPFDPRARHPVAEWIVRSHAGAFDRRVLCQEIDAQLDAFENRMQRPPAFVDGHEHVHQLPGVRDVLLEALAARGQRPWIRSTRRPAPIPGLKPRLIEALGAAALERQARAHGLVQNRRLLGVYAFDANDQAYLRKMRAWLALAQDGDLLMCHPAAAGCAGAPHAAARCREHALLAGTNFSVMLARARVQLVPLRAAMRAEGDPREESLHTSDWRASLHANRP
jgi:chitin disaccharide deacetylase